MEAFSVLENSYHFINNNFNYYRQNFGHKYYLGVREDEIKFIDKLFKNTEVILPAEDKMLNFSVSTIYTATAVLLEFMNRNNIVYSTKQIEQICKGFTNIEQFNVLFSDKTEKELFEILFGLLTDGIDLDSRKKSGSERTPDDIISYMLRLIDYNEDNSQYCSIVDPACGTGTFIKQIIDVFISGVNKHEAGKMVKKLLIDDQLIRAYDTKPSNVYITKVVVVATLIENSYVDSTEEAIEFMKLLPIQCYDFLKINDKADFVIGNPPYIRLQNLPRAYREYIKNNFVSATGRFDLFTCFMEKADGILKVNGKMCLITSNKYLTANYGIGIRRYFSGNGHVRKLIDLFDTKFFGAAVLPAIILAENISDVDSNVEFIGVKTSNQKAELSCVCTKELFECIEKTNQKNKFYINYCNKEVFEVAKAKVKIPDNGKTWNFSSNEDNTIKNKMDRKKMCSLEDIVDISVGIKTTADTVFVKPMTKEFVDKNGFENNAIYPLIQSFDVAKWKITWGDNKKDRYILYPHKEVNGNMTAIPLEEIPKAGRYLADCSDVLKKRKYLTESKNREWYECWVPQRLSKFERMKLVTRDIVSHNTFALDDKGMLCQGNTFFLTNKESLFSSKFMKMNEYQYFCFLLGILNSKPLEYYQKMISGCLYSQKYRYTTSNLSRWPIPNIDVDEAIRISDIVDEILKNTCNIYKAEEKINDIMYKKFDLKEEEIAKIENFIGYEREG